MHAKIINGTPLKNISRTNDKTQIPILYTKNIATDNCLQLFDNKKQYVSSKLILENNLIYNPSLIISRFYGDSDSEYKLKFAICTLDKFVCNENIFVISFPHLHNDNAVQLLTKIYKSLLSNKTKIWAKLFLKDGMISKYQIKHYLPIYI